jgi:hypothetical protein
MTEIEHPYEKKDSLDLNDGALDLGGQDDDDTLGNDSGTCTTSTATTTASVTTTAVEEEDQKMRKTTRKKRVKTPEATSLFVRSGYFFLWHILCVAIYLIPILSTSEYNKGEPVLDELHITLESNRDVNGETSLRTIFTNDYWGRPMQSASR